MPRPKGFAKAARPRGGEVLEDTGGISKPQCYGYMSSPVHGYGPCTGGLHGITGERYGIRTTFAIRNISKFHIEAAKFIALA